VDGTFTVRASQQSPAVSVTLQPALLGKVTRHLNPYCHQGIQNKPKRKLSWKRAGWISKHREIINASHAKAMSKSAAF